MGLLRRLFGGSDDGNGGASDRCMECGMTRGQHKDWCPAVAEADEGPVAVSPPEGAPSSRGEDGAPDQVTPQD